MGETRSLNDKLAQRFVESGKDRNPKHDRLAINLLFREDVVASGAWTKERAEEWGRDDNLEISAMSPEEQEELRSRVEQIRLARQAAAQSVSES